VAPYGAALILALGLLAITTSNGQALGSLAGLGRRLADPAQWAAFGIGLEQLLTGETIYIYVTGQGFAGLARLIDLSAAVLIMGLAASGIITLRRNAFGREAGVVTGWLVSLILFMLIAGPAAIQPHFERYAVWLIAPTALALAILIRRLFAREAMAISAMVIVTSLLLIGFREHYFQMLEDVGSRSARTFWTGQVEPKQAAHGQFAAIARTKGPIHVIAEDWWLFWPVRYLAQGEPIEVRNAEGRLPPQDKSTPRDELFWLVYNGSALDRRLSATPGARLRSAIDATGHPQALHIWWTPAQPPPAAAREPLSAAAGS
jgi:hypothetical protein